MNPSSRGMRDVPPGPRGTSALRATTVAAALLLLTSIPATASGPAPHGPSSAPDVATGPAPAAIPSVPADSQEPGPGGASPGTPTDTTHPGSYLRIYVVTMGQGDAIWERFGHNAIRVVDVREGTDVSWNWGTFDFDQTDFMPRLIRGTMLYWLAGWPTETSLREYQRTDRPVWAQELALTPEQKWTIRETIHTHALPENRHYRYDYYRDNCSTRVRDVIDRGLGGLLRAETGGEPTGTTWRWHTRRLLRGSPLAYAGIQLALGNRADDEISEWEEMFLPMRLRAHLRDVVVEGTDGEPRPLVAREVQILETSRGPTPAGAPFHLPWFALVGLGLGAGIAMAAVRAGRGSKAGRFAFGLVAGGWSLVAGAAGTLVLGAWLFTDHVFWAWNENLLQADPLALLLAPALVAVAWHGVAGPRTRGLAGAVAGLSLLGFLVQALPGFDQVNGEIIALALPPNLAVAWGVLLLSSGGSSGGRRGDRAAAGAGRAREAA